MTKTRTNRVPVREPEAPAAEAAREPVRAKTRTRRGGAGVNKYHIPQEMIPDGIDLQWNVDTVLGQPQTQERMAMEQQAWEPVTGDMWDGRFDGMFMRRGHQGEINVGGLVLMWRPMELTHEARAEELHHARQARYVEEAKIKQGTPDGVNLDMLNPNHGSARAKTFLRSERIPSMPIQD